MGANSIALVLSRVTAIQFTGAGLPLALANRTGHVTLGSITGNCFKGKLLL